MAVNPEDFYNGDGSRLLFPFTFEYLEESDVKVSVGGVVQTQTTHYTFANATTIEFVTAPATGTDNVRIYRDTNVDNLKATFFPGSSIRAQDLNDNLNQNNYAVQEIKAYYWDNETDTIHSNENWVSSDTQIATTAAMDARFQDEVNDTLTKAELAALSDVIPDNDDAVPTTGAVKDYVDHVIETDILVDNTGLNKSGSGGQVTIGISAGSVDLDRIKADDIITSAEANPNNDTTIATTAKIDDMIDAAITGDIGTTGAITVTDDGDGTITLGLADNTIDFSKIKDDDIITYAEQNAGSPAPADTNIFTASAAARRFDTLVQTGTPSGSDWETGKTWLQNDNNLTLSVWNGSAWTGITSGGTFTNQPKVVYVDATAGDNNNDGHRISRPKLTIKAAVEQINAEINTSITNGGSGYVDSSYTNVPLTGGNGTGLQANITVSGGVVTAATVTSTTTLQDYSIGDVLSASNANLGGSGSGFQLTVGGDGDGQVVIVAAGVYQEAGPIQIKRRNVSIIGQALRSCIVHPTVATQGDQSDGNHALFELNSGSYIANLTLTGMKAGSTGTNTLDSDLPIRQGWNFAFYEDAFITKSPYIQNCTNFSDSQINNSNLNSHNPAGGQAGDTTSAPTGGGMLINGSAPHDDSPLRSMVADSYTHVGLNGPGVLVVNNGYAQITSSYAFFNRYHIKCLSGGQANLAASTTDFGDQALVADGRSTNAVFTSTTIAAAANQATEFFIDGPTARTATPLPWHGTDTRPQSNMLVDIGGNTYPILSSSNVFTATEIISGRTYTIVTVGGTDFTAIGAASNTVGVTFTATGVGTGSGTVTDSTGYRVSISRPNPNNRSQNLGLNGAVASSSAVSFFLRSQVASSGHTMEYVGSGTNYTALPENGGVPDETRQITELNNGKVWTAVTDHNGKFKVGGNQTDDPFFEVDQQLGFVTIPAGSIAFNLVSDLSPQLGANLDVNGNTITGLANPTANDEVANKAYVDSTAGSPTQIIQLNTSVATSDTGTDGTITFTNDGTESARIDSSGRLLVGTSSASGNSTAHFQGNAGASIGGAFISLQRGATNPSSGTELATISFADNAPSHGAQIQAFTDGDWAASDFPTRLVFSTTADGASSPTERMRISANGNLAVDTNTFFVDAVNNRVGLGTSAPTEILHAVGNIKLEVAAANNATRSITARSDFGGGTFFDNAGVLLVQDTAGSSGGHIELQTMPSGGSSLVTALTVDDGQRVGIGTTTVNDKVVIAHADDEGLTFKATGTDGTTATQITYEDTNGGTGGILQFDHGNNSFSFETAGSERARIDSSGRLLVGTSSAPTDTGNGAHYSKLISVGNTASASGDGRLALCRGNTAANLSSGSGIGELHFADSAGGGFASISAFADATPGTNDYPGRLVFSTTADGASSPTERMRIDRNGDVQINAANVNPNASFSAYGDQSRNGNAAYIQMTGCTAVRNGLYSYLTTASGHPTNSTSYAIQGQGASINTVPLGAVIGIYGSIYGILGYYTGSQTWAFYGVGSSYVSGSYQGSDERLKENIVEIQPQGVLEKLDSIRSVKYTWKENSSQYRSGSTETEIGFLAQEVQQHFPEAVIGVDCTSCNTEEEETSLNHELGTTYGVDYGKMVPVLLAALKEAKTRIETLEAKVTALENP